MSHIPPNRHAHIPSADCLTVLSSEDNGIHIADAAADSLEAPVFKVYHHAPLVIRATVQCDDILRELLTDGVWHWTHDDPANHVPILNDPM